MKLGHAAIQIRCKPHHPSTALVIAKKYISGIEQKQGKLCNKFIVAIFLKGRLLSK